jgi:hypothetical protein
MASQGQRIRRDWASVVRDQERSGLSVRSYCDEHGINASLFYHRRRGLALSQGAEGSGGFVRVHPTEEGAPSTGVTLVSPQGWRVEVAPGFDVQTLLRVCGCMEQGEACSR